MGWLHATAKPGGRDTVTILSFLGSLSERAPAGGSVKPRFTCHVELPSILFRSAYMIQLGLVVFQSSSCLWLWPFVFRTVPL